MDLVDARGAPLQVRLRHRHQLLAAPRRGRAALRRRHILRPDELPRVVDRAAGAIKTGGTTRRAAKMVCLDIDHPEIEDFINWKADEEKKVAALIDGRLPERLQRRGLPHRLRPELEQLGPRHRRVHQGGRRGRRLEPDLPHRRQGAQDRQGARAVAADRRGRLALRRSGRAVRHHDQRLAHLPGSGRINASNPCTEYMFLDDTACNLASLNLLKFFDAETGQFDIEGYKHAIRLWTIVLEICVLMAQLPERGDRASCRYNFRTLGLGYANLGTLLMQARHPLRQRQGPRHRRRAHRDHDRRVLRDLAPRWRASSAPFPGYDENKRAHAARDPQPPPGRVRRRRPTRVRAAALESTAGRHRRRQFAADPIAARAPRARRWDRALASASATATATRRPP